MSITTMSFLKKRLQRSMDKWLSKRLPPLNFIELTLNNIFIVPSKSSLGLLVVLLLMLILAVNYQNSLVYLFVFWISSSWLVSIHMTFRHLMGVKIKVIGYETCHAKQQASITLRIYPNKKQLTDLCLFWSEDQKYWLNFHDNAPQDIQLLYPTSKRGKLIPKRIRIENRSPAGLAVAWSHLAFDVTWWIYPKAQRLTMGKINTTYHDDNDQEAGQWQKGNTDFSHLRTYQAGDALKRIHWRQFAKTGELSTREFVDYKQTDLWINWRDYSALSQEVWLSAMCADILDYQKNQLSFGLRLPNSEIEIGSGEQHIKQCLEALARF
jgi:uncharacterized protein (DUF58 family)